MKMVNGAKKVENHWSTNKFLPTRRVKNVFR